MKRTIACTSALVPLLLAAAIPAAADSFTFTSGDPDGRMATATRPGGASGIEIESADDFILKSPVNLTGGTLTGLLPAGASVSSISNVVVEIYRVFPKDSVNPPSGNVPTRVNSPSDVAFDERSVADGNLTMSATILNPSFTAANSVLNGINPSPGQNTGGEGPVTGQEVQISVNFSTPFSLPADHYFFVPQVELSNGNFFWLSTTHPAIPPATVLTPDLQEWIRNENLAPDWLRVGADIVGGTTFNTVFTLAGTTTPEPSAYLLMGSGLALLAAWSRRKRIRK